MMFSVVLTVTTIPQFSVTDITNTEIASTQVKLKTLDFEGP